MTQRKRNPLNLSLPPTLNEEGTKDDSAEESKDSLLDAQLQNLALSQPQVERLHDWISQKRQIGEISEEVLERISELGHGNGGVVHKMRHKTSNVILARKLVHLEVKPSIRNQIMKELNILHQCNSPYIVGFYGAFMNINDISICMEFMDGLSLDIVLQLVGRVEEKWVGRIAVAVIRGLAYLKEQFNILHRDVKPSNMLVNSQGEIKLCDFGVSAVLIDSMANSFVGTRSYMAPERLTGARYSIQSDIWSFGLSLVELVIGRYPIPSPTRKEYAKIFSVTVDDVQFDEGIVDETSEAAADETSPKTLAIFELLDYIVNNPPPVLPRKIFSDLFVDFVGKCLKKNPTERANQTVLMNDPFFKKHGDLGDTAEFAKWVTSVIDFRNSQKVAQ